MKVPRHPEADLCSLPDPGTLPRIDYVRQRSSDLVFHLFDSPAPREAVRVLVERTVTLPGGGFTLAIIGSSHFLEVTDGAAVLCELMACPRPGLNSVPLRKERSRPESWSYRTRRGKITYQFESWRQGFSRAEFDGESVRLSAPAPNRLRYAFPEGDGPRSALTCLEWQSEGRRATIATSHTFPEESAIVRTRSVIDLASEESSS